MAGKERPRERLIAEGPERLTDAELLAIILRVGRGAFKEGVPGQNATDFSKEWLTAFKGLRGLDRAHIQDLLKVPGLNNAKVSEGMLVTTSWISNLFNQHCE